jgi:hypothetical protein
MMGISVHAAIVRTAMILQHLGAVIAAEVMQVSKNAETLQIHPPVRFVNPITVVGRIVLQT